MPVVWCLAHSQLLVLSFQPQRGTQSRQENTNRICNPLALNVREVAAQARRASSAERSISYQRETNAHFPSNQVVFLAQVSALLVSCSVLLRGCLPRLRSHLQNAGRLETSVNYQPTLCKNPEEQHLDFDYMAADIQNLLAYFQPVRYDGRVIRNQMLLILT
jgi:hypothetical protein